MNHETPPTHPVRDSIGNDIVARRVAETLMGKVVSTVPPELPFDGDDVSGDFGF